MEAVGAVVLSFSSTYYAVSSLNNSPQIRFRFIPNSSRTRFSYRNGIYIAFPKIKCNKRDKESFFSCSVDTSPLKIENSSPNYKQDTSLLFPKIDKSGRFCNPRAARELALMILYAACLEGSDAVRLFEKRLHTRTELAYEFDKGCLLEYDHMSFGGPPVTTQTAEEADDILRHDQKESDIEAKVLSAPPKLVYSKLILRFTRKLLIAVAEKWDSNVLAIDKVAPIDWKIEPAGRILEFSILHLAMSEIAVLGTRHQIVINEAVDLAKRFCDGAAPRVINGCLRTYVREVKDNGETQNVKIEATV